MIVTNYRKKCRNMTNTEQAIWKPYPEIPFIEANQFGEIRTKDRYVLNGKNSKRLVKGHVLKQYLLPNGYVQVTPRINGKTVHLSVHRVVIASHLPNPDNLPEVNHIDNDPTNNRLDNLEYCTREYNNAYREKYGTSAKEYTKVLRHPVIAIDPDNSETFWFESQHEASRQLDVNVTHVSDVVNGKYNQTGGFWFCNADENAVEKTRVKFGDDIANKVEKLMNEHRN